MRSKTKILYMWAILATPIASLFVSPVSTTSKPIEPVAIVEQAEPVVRLEQQPDIAPEPPVELVVQDTRVIAPTVPPIMQPGQPTDGDKGQILFLHNEYRQQHGLSILSYDYNLDMSAQEKAEDLWSHNRPNGETPWVVIGKYSSFSSAGENLARGFNDPSDVMNGWYNSPTHLANIVGDWQMMGVGWYHCSIDGLTYVAVHFKIP